MVHIGAVAMESKFCARAAYNQFFESAFYYATTAKCCAVVFENSTFSLLQIQVFEMENGHYVNNGGCSR